MQKPCNSIHANVASGSLFIPMPITKCIRGACCVVFALILYPFSSIAPSVNGKALEPAAPIRYSIVSIIHGDGEYAYHDSSGDEHAADEDALLKAKTVATQNPNAEVFIFHEIPQKHFLIFFPLRDGEFYYYRGGRLIDSESYRRYQDSFRFAPEIELYDRFHVEEQGGCVRLFLYFGHEIPEFAGYGYDESHPERIFTVNDLAEGLKHITHDSAKFDLVVLGTCYNGTPRTIESLAPYAQYIVASPENLHLSYFDLSPLEHLETSLQSGGIAAFAKNFAQNAFDKLTKEVETAITVAVYDVDKTKPFLHYARKDYERTMTTLATFTNVQPESIAHCDCAENTAYGFKGMNDGVEIFYRAPQFGRAKSIQNHSGWECWKDKVWQTTNRQLLENAQK